MLHRHRRRAASAVAFAAACAAVVPAYVGAETATAATCTKMVSPKGNDAWSGSPSAPFRTVQKLVNSLKAGQTGCLASGASFTQDVTVSTAASASYPITLTTVPGGARATLKGRLYFRKSATDWVVTNLNLDGRNASGGKLPSPTVNGTRITFRGNDVTNYNTEICFSIGSDPWTTYGTAVDVVIDRNRIHNCGVLPSTNLDHGIYIDSARDTRITNNYIYDNADRGIQLYPDAQGTVIMNNVIDGNGSGMIFSGAEGYTSSNTVVRANVITNARARYNVESWYPTGNPVGTDNFVSLNCVYGGKQGNIATQVGFSASSNTFQDPLYVNRAAKDFRLASNSPCAGMGPT